MHRPSLPSGISWYSFLEAKSTPGHMELSDAPEKIPSVVRRIFGQGRRRLRKDERVAIFFS